MGNQTVRIVATIDVSDVEDLDDAIMTIEALLAEREETTMIAIADDCGNVFRGEEPEAG